MSPAARESSPAPVITPGARAQLAEAIAGYRGQEIFFGGLLDEEGAVDSVTLLARGNKRMVPVIFEAAQEYPVVIHNHPSSYLEPSDADLEIASALGNRGIGFYIISNEADDVNVVVPHRPAPTMAPIDGEAIADFFGPTGELSRRLPGYESRPSQVEMLSRVVTAFNGERILLCEAPTGTGKSLGYLVPAVHWVRTNGEKVIVSTHTIALQEQLILRDLPRLHEMLGGRFTFALAKGRNHYLCLRKFGEFLAEPTFFDDEAGGSAESLIEWGKSTKTGDRAELDFVPAPGLWDRLASESDTCRPSKCPNADRCFVQQARRRIFAADIIVVNHHVLCADAAIKHKNDRFDAQALLPPWRRVIIDEGHNLEETATDHFGRGYSSISVTRTLNQLHRPGRGGRGTAGLLGLMGHRLRTGHTRLSGEDHATALTVLDSIEKARTRFADEAPLYHQNLYDFLSNREGTEFGEKKFRIHGPVLEEPAVVNQFRPNLTALLDRLHAVVVGLEKLQRLLMDEREDEVWEQHLYELAAYAGRLGEAAGVLEALLDPSPDADEGKVRWMSANRFSRGGILISAALTPLAVGPNLRDAVFAKATTVVLTSATLTDHRGFGFLRERLGLIPGQGELFREIDEVSLPPVFDYRKQCVGFIPSDLPMPQDRAFAHAAAGRVLEAARYFHGRTLVLFTSYTSLSQMREMLRDTLMKEGVRLLCQGEAPRSQLLDEFRGGTPTVLFGVSSFWEGVDVPGDALSCLVLVKLPFAVPSEPVSQARCEALEKQGKSSFAEFSLPTAVLKFRQGFGRLIRTGKDRGIFLMLDRRLIDKPYGRDFLKALPPVRIFKGTVFSEVVEDFYGK